MFERLKSSNEILADCLHNVGLAYYWNKEYPNSLEYLRKAEEIYKKVSNGNDSKEIAKCLKNLSFAYEAVKDKANSSKIFLLSEEMAKRLQIKIPD